MTYRLTYQSDLHERPVSQSYDSADEAEQARRDIWMWFDGESISKKIKWKIEPTVRPEQ